MVNTRRGRPVNAGGDLPPPPQPNNPPPPPPPSVEERIAAALDRMLPNLVSRIANDIRNDAGPSVTETPQVGIDVWMEKFNKLRPFPFKTAATPNEAEDWVSHIEKIFEVLGCADGYKVRLSTFKFEGDALNWWKNYKQAKGGDQFAVSCTWVSFKEIFYHRYFSTSVQQQYEREYNSIHQLDTEHSGQYMERFVRLAIFVGPSVIGDARRQAKHFKWNLKHWILDRIINIEFNDVAECANATRNIELLYEGNYSKRSRDGDMVQYSGRQDSRRGSDHRGRSDRGYDRGQGQKRDEHHGSSSGAGSGSGTRGGDKVGHQG